MMIRIRRIILTTLALLVCTVALAQRATEVYIPIGESPGVSGSESIIGAIIIVDYEQHRMTISTAGENRSVAVTPQTRYYMDMSSAKKRNLTAAFDDCTVGRRIEAYTDANDDAIWVKIAAP